MEIPSSGQMCTSTVPLYGLQCPSYIQIRYIFAVTWYRLSGRCSSPTTTYRTVLYLIVRVLSLKEKEKTKKKKKEASPCLYLHRIAILRYKYEYTNPLWYPYVSRKIELWLTLQCSAPTHGTFEIFVSTIDSSRYELHQAHKSSENESDKLLFFFFFLLSRLLPFPAPH